MKCAEYIECDRKIPEEALKRAFLNFPRLDRKKTYPLYCIEIHDNKIIDHENNIFDISCLEDIMMGKSVVTGNLNKIKELYNKEYISINKGGCWGYLFAIDNEDMKAIDLYKDFSSKSEKMKEIGWDFDGVWKSGQKMAEDVMRQTCPYIPNLRGISMEHITRAWNCFRGGVMEAQQLGMFSVVYSYDTNKAYLGKMVSLPDVSPDRMRWISSREYIKEASIGFCKVDYSIINDSIATRFEISPVDGSRLFSPSGHIIGFRTKSEIDLIQRSGYGKVHEILEGSWGISKDTNRMYFPFKELAILMSKALVTKELKAIAKDVCSKCWGKFISIYGSLIFNPIYASEITALQRNELSFYKSVIQESQFIAKTIDGIETTHQQKYMHINEDIGGWKVERRTACISLSDYYRDYDGAKHGWSFDNDNILVPTPKINKIQRVRFGSAKRELGRNYKLRDLNEVGIIHNPSIQKCQDILNEELLHDGEEVSDVDNQIEGNIERNPN